MDGTTSGTYSTAGFDNSGVRFTPRKLFKLRLKNQLYNLMMATISKLKNSLHERHVEHRKVYL
jgi:hypothetical protein